MQSALYTGQLEHRRHGPVSHGFTYPATLVWLDLAELDSVFSGRWFWSTRRPAPAWMRRADYLGDASTPLHDAVRDKVASETGRRPRGPVRLLTQLRMLGFCFNPVSFYYCYDESASRVEAIVAEITNTPWNERHAYVLEARPGGGPAAHLQFSLTKSFHVSPFMPMDIDYDWHFSSPGRELLVHMRSKRAGRRVFDASLQLRRREISTMSLAGTLLRQPVAGMTVLWRIYWQALRLRLKKAPFYDHPAKRIPEKTA